MENCYMASLRRWKRCVETGSAMTKENTPNIGWQEWEAHYFKEG